MNAIAPEPPPRTFAQLLREARESAGMSRSQLARELGSPEQNVINWERGRSRPSFRYVLLLQKTLPDLAMPSYRSGKRKSRPEITEPRQLPMVTMAR